MALILGAVATLVAPMVDRWSPGYALRSAAGALEARLGAARALALQHRRTYRVAYDLGRNETWTTGDEPAYRVAGRREEEPVLHERLAGGVRLEAVRGPSGEAREGVVAFEVHPSGRVDPHEVVLALQGVGKVVVRTDPLCGAVEAEWKEE